MLTYTYDVVYDIVGKPTMSYTTSQHVTGKNSPPAYDIVGKYKIVYDIVGLTYDVVYDVTYDVVGATGKNSILHLRCRR